MSLPFPQVKRLGGLLFVDAQQVHSPEQVSCVSLTIIRIDAIITFLQSSQSYNMQSNIEGLCCQQLFGKVAYSG